MKRYTYYILAALLAFVSQTAQAQTEQDALYIYRNDGGFNAFFFDDIDYFEYSCIDTLGVEHDDYVTQEVHALDSIFRIPLTAIDSIAFVTPEPVYKKDIVKIDKKIVDYVVATDSMNWIRLDNSTPENLIPNKGDKILIEENSKSLPDGFGGRVTSVEKTALGITVSTEALEPEEAFERAVFKASFGSDVGEGARTRGNEPIYGSETPIVLGPYIGSVKLSGSTNFIELADVFTVSGNLLGEVQYDIRPTIRARGFFSIDPLAGIHFDNYVDTDIDFKAYAKVTGSISTRLDAPFPSVYTYQDWDTTVKKGKTGYAKVSWKIGMFMEGGGDVYLDGAVDGKLNASGSLSYYKPALGFGGWTPDYNVSWHPTEEIGNGMGMDYGCGEFYFTDGLYLETMFEFTNPLTKNLLGAGHRLELAPKISSKAVVLDDISDDLNETLWVNQAYAKLDRDDIFKFDLYASWDPYVKRGDWQYTLGGEKLSTSLFSYETGAVPSIQLFRVDRNEDIGSFYGLATYMLQRHLPFPSKVGFVMEDAYENIVEEYWRPETYRYPNIDMEVQHEFIFDPLVDEDTWYYVHPVVTFLGRPMLTTDYGPGYIEVDKAFIDTPEKIELNDKEEEIELNPMTNIPDVTFHSAAEWLDVDWQQLGMLLFLKHGEVPDNLDSRQTTLSMIAKNSKGEVLIEREIPVIQKADPNKIKFTVTPSTIDVPGYSAEFQKGKISKQFTVTYPRSATALTVTSSDDSWLTADNGGGIGSGSNTCNITIKANTSLKNSRKGTITVQLTKSDGSTATKTITVNQSAMSIKVEAIPDDITLEAQKDEDSDVSDTKTVNIKITPYDDFIASLIKDQNVTSNAEWIHYSQNGTAIQIWADINPIDESRENTVTYTLTLTTGDVITSTIKVTQLKPEGDPSVIDAGGFHFSAKEGDQTITISEPNVERILKVDAPYDSWIGVAGSGLKLTVTVKENTTPNERIGLVKVTAKMKDGTEATLFYQVTQDAGAGFGEISSIDLYVKVAESTTYDDGETYAGKYQRNATVSTDKGEITTTPKGLNGLHVVCTQTIDDWHLYNYTVTFDIDDIYGLQSRTAQILNLKFHLTEDEQSATEIGHGEEGISIPSIPMNGENQWGGTAGDGVEFNSFVDKYHSTTYNEEGEVSYSYSRSSKLVNSSDNTVRIKLNFR